MTTAVEVSFGSVTFTGAQIKEAHLVEQINPLAVELPINTLEFTLFSADDDFSIVNPSGFYASLQYNQPLEVTEIIDGTPYYIGKFYLDTWESISENEATFRAIDAIGLLENITYPGLIEHSGDIFPVNSEDLIEEILTTFADVAYNLDTSLEGFSNFGTIPAGSCRTALQQVCFRLGAYATCARSDVINIVPIELASELSVIDYTIQASQKGLGQPIALLPLVTGAEVVSHSFKPDTVSSAITVFDNEVPVGQHIIIFNEPVHTTSYGGSATYSIVQFRFAWMEINVTVAGTFTVNGKPFINSKRLAGIYNNSLPVGTKANIVSVTDATLIFPKTQPFPPTGTIYPSIVEDTAQRVYDYYQQRYLQKARLYAHPLKVGDSVLITMQSKWIAGIVERIEINLAGGFISQMEIVGVIPTCANILTANLTVLTGVDQTYTDCLDTFGFNVDLQGSANLIIN